MPCVARWTKTPGVKPERGESESAVADDERKSLGILRTNVDEMNVQPINAGDELRQRIQLRFRLPPVVIGRPIARELLHGRQRHALRLVGDSLLLGPLRGRNAPSKVIELGLGGVEGEGADRLVFGRLARSGRRGNNDSV